MKQGNVQGPLNSLSMSNSGGVLNLDDTVTTGGNNVNCSGRNSLADKHPPSTVPSPEILLQEDQWSEALNPIVFDSLNADLILKAALKTKGSSRLVRHRCVRMAYIYRLCSSFKSASKNLCSSLAAVPSLTAESVQPLFTQIRMIYMYENNDKLKNHLIIRAWVIA